MVFLAMTLNCSTQYGTSTPVPVGPLWLLGIMAGLLSLMGLSLMFYHAIFHELINMRCGP